MAAKLSHVLTGVSGEYFVAAELSRRGYIASITLRNTQGIDILASDRNAQHQVAVQVKTNQNNKREWILNSKAEELISKSFFYIFVDFGKEDHPPEYFIVPSEKVAQNIRSSHRKFLSTPGKDGKLHKDSTMRKFEDFKGKYLGKWELLNL